MRTCGQKRGGKGGESVQRSLQILAFALIVSNQESWNGCCKSTWI